MPSRHFGMRSAKLLGSSIWDSEPIVPIITDPSIVGCDIAWCQACNVAHNVQAIGLFIIFLFYSLHPSDVQWSTLSPSCCLPISRDELEIYFVHC
ncbi:unnamed protein product [Mycena citricolor]|uniref:Uncharacterized protein n=1 Tax=Mycena citricolor TaxID=2018698 RepID=A0AAD2Q348_9AGAR|nr:unnamed protein product [Mycena citricolor]